MVCGHLSFINYSFHRNKSKKDFYRGEGSWKKFCANLKEQVREIINCKRKLMLSLTKEKETSLKEEKLCDICKYEFNELSNDDGNKCRVRDHCHCIGKFRDPVLCYL